MWVWNIFHKHIFREQCCVVGETVYSLAAMDDDTRPVHFGIVGYGSPMRGVVRGPASDGDQGKVAVLFEGHEGRWDVPLKLISRTEPSKVRLFSNTCTLFQIECE